MGNGHGTIITGSEGQGNVKVEVKDNGGSSYYKAGTTQTAIVAKGVSVKENSAVSLDWDKAKNAITVTGVH